MKYCVYILRCEDGYLYTGLTSNLARRLNQHKMGLSRLTKNRGKQVLVYSQLFDSIHAAAMREKEIKGWRREKKEKIIISLDTKAPNGEACSEERSHKR